ncbi:DUF2069 domain-containing protein [Massilia sp. GCM10020059]|uniref:DUF2069 domain-containing protein n=1 Tax=Massilia agrisoli TaxID=2892444 RepID=A0ABS8IVF1_9BURK|nr:DUF2069 domain-containing protein [Massilia agrisoli]MCC6072441.1 DUF2069 domain-containing protein [Massilia agrisoli]
METSKVYHIGAAASLMVLIAWLLAWEMVVAPLKPGGSLLALKVVPLLLPLRGVLKRDVYTLQWSSMLILLYFAEGVVRGYSDRDEISRMMGYGEVALVCIYFACALLFLHPYKKAARKLARELLDKVNRATHE